MNDHVFLEVSELLLSAVLDVGAAWLLMRRVRADDGFVRTRKSLQLVSGLLFGALAAVSCWLNVGLGGALLNFRDAAPVICALLFGAPGGILAGAIGGVVRLVAGVYGVGPYTAAACALSTVISGLLGAAMRRWVFQDRHPSALYAFMTGAVAAVTDMLLILLLHITDLEVAFVYVDQCAVPMIVGTGICVMAAALVTRSDHSEHHKKGRDGLEEMLQKRLAVSVAIAFFATVALSVTVQSHLAAEDTSDLLETQLRDLPAEIGDAVDGSLTEYTGWIAQRYEASETEGNIPAFLTQLTEADGLTDVFVVDREELVLESTASSLKGKRLDLSDVLQNPRPYGEAGPWQPSFSDPDVSVRYGAYPLGAGDTLLAGYREDFVAGQLERQVALGVLHRHVGTDGYLFLVDDEGTIVSGPEDVGENAEEHGFQLHGSEMTLRTSDLHGRSYMYMYADVGTVAGRYIGIAAIPEEEVLRGTAMGVDLNVFIAVLIFFVLFIHLSLLIRHRIVKEIHAFNAALARIAAGKLDTCVTVDSAAEFQLLSHDINATVGALRDLIAKEAARVDAELELARTIQRTSLPSVFPPYPEHHEFEISALMEPAREVGGDFYDFYMLGSDRLAFMVADVSGKGIPAAMFMMRAKTQLKSLMETGTQAEEAFRRANNALCENNEAGMFVTAWLGELDLVTGEITCVNAGHNPVITAEHCGGGGDASFQSCEAGFVLGGLEDFPYQVSRFTLEPGALLVLYTDGVTEAENGDGEQFGNERLLETVRKASAGSTSEVCTAVRNAVAAFTAGEEQFDDITILAVRWLGRTEHDGG